MLGYDHGGPGVEKQPRRAALARRPVDVVVIGGGVRLDPAQTPALEALVNAVIEAAPGARRPYGHWCLRQMLHDARHALEAPARVTA